MAFVKLTEDQPDGPVRTTSTTPTLSNLVTEVINGGINNIAYNGRVTANQLAAMSPLLKPVEAIASFQKLRSQLGEQTLNGAGLRYTFCDSTDFTQRPFSNLFNTFHIPTASAERVVLRSRLNGTALAALANVDKFIAIEIPRDQYGELVDGKSIELDIPQKSGTTQYSVKCFSTFYHFNPDLNSQVSDANPISSLFSGIEPVQENDFNTNIAYMFSNNVARPKDAVATNTVFEQVTSFLSPGNSETIVITGGLQRGVQYSSNLYGSRTRAQITFTTGLGELPMADVMDLNATNDYTFLLKYDVSAVTIKNIETFAFTTYLAFVTTRAISSRDWGKWEPSHRFPTTAAGSGKVIAQLVDIAYNTLIDEPIGLAYLDKGFILITNPTLVANFDITGAKQLNAANTVINYVPPANSDKTKFTQIFFLDATRSQLKCRSVVTEYSQSYTCLAMPNEFYDSSNPTFRQAYPVGGNSAQQPVQITEIGLYNAHGEMVAIAKTTKPLVKFRNSVAIFNISLKI